MRHNDVAVAASTGRNAPHGEAHSAVPLPPSTMYVLKAAESGVRQHLTRVLTGSGITVAECVSLSILQQIPTMSSSELARRTFVTPQTMQSVVNSLVDKGLLHRRRSSSDRREVRLSVTEDGAALMTRLTPYLQQIDDAIAGGLSPAEHAMLRELLERVRHSLGDAEPVVPGTEITGHEHTDPQYGDLPSTH